MDIQRLILFIALGLVSMLLVQNWEAYQLQKNPPVMVDQPQDNNLPAAQQGTPGGLPAEPDTSGIPAVDAPSAAPLQAPSQAGGELVEVVTDLLDVKINTQGGSLSYAALTQYPKQLETPDDPVVLLQDNQFERYLAESGLTGTSVANLPNHHTQYSAEKSRYELGGGESLEIPLSYTSPEGIVYRKIYTFHRNSYRIDIRYQVENTSDQPWTGYFYGQLMRTPVGSKQGGSILTRGIPSFVGGAFYTPEEHYNKVKFSAIDDGDTGLPQDTESGWVAMLEHYFVGTWIPSAEGKYRFYTRANKQAQKPEYAIGFVGMQATTIAPGASGELGAAMYIGPKERNRLEAQNADKLELVVDFGWLTVIAEPLFWVMRQIHRWVGNWGWTIILITILIKAAFLPLSAASYKSMAKMKKLSPRLKTLKERYGDDKQTFQQEMMKLYREEKVNPAGGCLPILVQIPVFIALYWVLLESVEMRQAPWAFWIHDLSSKDPYYILPLLMGASMLIQQLLNPSPMDKTQQRIMMALPVVFTIFFLSFPAGLVLYWVVNNTLSIAQQWMISRRYQ